MVVPLQRDEIRNLLPVTSRVDAGDPIACGICGSVDICDGNPSRGRRSAQGHHGAKPGLPKIKSGQYHGAIVTSLLTGADSKPKSPDDDMNESEANIVQRQGFGGAEIADKTLEHRAGE